MPQPPMLDVVVVMDPIGAIKTAKDSTFAMLLEAQRRGHRLHYVRPGGLAVRDGTAVADVAPLAVRDEQGRHFELGEWGTLAFGPGQVVLMRTDPPVDANYLHDWRASRRATRPAATSPPAAAAWPSR